MFFSASYNSMNNLMPLLRGDEYIHGKFYIKHTVKLDINIEKNQLK